MLQEKQVFGYSKVNMKPIYGRIGMTELLEIYNYKYVCETNDHKSIMWMGIFGRGYNFYCMWNYDNE
jgi:hypothetical protein